MEAKVVAVTDNNPLRPEETCEPVGGISTDYFLSKERCLSKMIKACSRENYTIERKDKCATVKFSTASFMVFRKAIARYYHENPDYVIHHGPVRDQASNVAQDIVRVHDHNKRNAPLYTLNVYRMDFVSNRDIAFKYISMNVKVTVLTPAMDLIISFLL